MNIASGNIYTSPPKGPEVHRWKPGKFDIFNQIENSLVESLEMFAILIPSWPGDNKCTINDTTSLMMEPNTIIVMEIQCNWWNRHFAPKYCSLDDDKDSILTGWFIFAADWSHSTHNKEKGLRRVFVSLIKKTPGYRFASQKAIFIYFSINDNYRVMNGWSYFWQNKIWCIL